MQAEVKLDKQRNVLLARAGRILEHLEARQHIEQLTDAHLHYREVLGLQRCEMWRDTGT